MISPIQFTASDWNKPTSTDVHVQGPDLELHPNLLKASFHMFRVKAIYRAQQMKKAEEAFGSKVKPISAAGPESSPSTTLSGLAAEGGLTRLGR